MIINNVLDEVFSTWSNIAVLRVLNRVKIGLSGREIAKQAGMSAPSCLKALSTLENLNIVLHLRGGRDHFFSLNRDHFIAEKIITPLLAQERKFKELLLEEIVKELDKISVSIFLFGSVVRKEESIKSDLDICIVYQTPALKRKTEIKIAKLGSLLHTRFGVSIAPFYISEREFIKKIKLKKSPVVNILQEGKLLFGKTFKY